MTLYIAPNCGNILVILVEQFATRAVLGMYSSGSSAESERVFNLPPPPKNQLVY